MGSIRRLAVALSALAALAGCDGPPLVEAPARPAAPQSAGVGSASDESAALARYYERVESGLVARGLLRADGGGPDAPFTAKDLARNFERIALFEEFATLGGRLVAQETESRLHRWDRPIRLNVEIGAEVDPARAARDRNAIASYASRLSRLIGLPITEVGRDANFHVFVVTEAERRALGPRLMDIVPGLSQAALDTVIDLPRSSYCLVFASDADQGATYQVAVAVIRAEHPDLLRLSCIHEEMAQGLGLSNDSPAARPSVFNDDEEFGLLTTHDELLLRMLYDPRLRPGMTRDEAMPIARVIAEELMAQRKGAEAEGL